MSFGFPAYSTGSRRFDLAQPELADVVGESLSNLRWHHESPLSNVFTARNSVNLWSWGERLIITVAQDGTVTARSECLLATQCFDWGKNRKNVEEFFDQIFRVVLAHKASRSQVMTHEETSLTPLERVIRAERVQ